MDDILKNYANLLSSYESSRKTYDEIIQSYKASATDTNEIFCTKIECYDMTAINTVIVFYSLDGKELYKSNIIKSEDTSVIYLDTTPIPINTSFKIGYLLTDSSSSGIGSTILRYVPDSNATSYFALKSNPYNFYYTGVVPAVYYPNADPYLKSSGLVIKNNATALTKYALYTLDGIELYRSDRVGFGDTYRLNFKDANIEADTLLTVKALVAGSDSSSDVIMQYIPDSYYVAKFELHGGFAENTLIFDGSYSLIPDPSLFENGDQFMLYNNSNMSAKFALLLPDGTKVYETDTTSQFDSRLINVNNITVPIGMYLRVKIIIPAKDFASDRFIRYIPHSGTAYFKLYGNAGIPDSRGISYYGVLSPETIPPLVRCSKIVALNDSNMITKWSLKIGDETIYLSGRYRTNKTWTLDLSTISLQPGTRFLLKSNAIGAKDAIAFVTIEYAPESNIAIHFQFVGSLSKDILIYEGII